MLETHSKYWIIDGFPTHTQDNEIIAEVRYLADLAGLSLADKELNGKLHRIPRKTGMNAVIVILSQEFHFIQPYDERDNPKSAPYHGKYVGQRILPAKANKKKSEVRRAHYLCQPLTTSILYPQLIGHKLTQIGYFDGFLSDHFHRIRILCGRFGR